MALESGIPTAREIEEQLQRMLASDRFRRADKQSEFLALVARRALSGKKTPGHIIAKALFPDSIFKSPDGKLRFVGHDVRETAKNLRKTLRSYYAGEGRQDAITITLREPSEDRTIKLAEGEAYTPRFAYSAVHPVTNKLTLGNYFHHHQLIGEEEIALLHFAEALAICPDHIDAAIGVTEACCTLRDWGQKLDGELGPVLDKAVKVLNAELLRESKDWRVRAAIGNLLWHTGLPVSQAAEHFEQARTLDRIRTESHQPYLLFLLHLGQVDEALMLSKRFFDAHQDDNRACIPYLWALIAAKRYRNAARVLERTLAIHKSDPYLRYLMVQLKMCQGYHEAVIDHIKLMKALMDQRTFELTMEDLEKRFGLLFQRLRCEMRLTQSPTDRI